MKKLSKKKLAEARIQRAVTGFIIPVMAIPNLYKLLEAAVAAGQSDDELKSIVANYPDCGGLKLVCEA